MECGVHKVITDCKDFFLENEIWILSFLGGFQRAHIYKNMDLREEFKNSLKQEIRKIVLSNYVNTRVSTKQHIENLEYIIAWSTSSPFNSILRGGKLRWGVVQKIFNLYLKYLWCWGRIPSPPHCPFDSFILNHLGFNSKWTRMNSKAEYLEWVETAASHAQKKGLSVPEWELSVYEKNRILTQTEFNCLSIGDDFIDFFVLQAGFQKKNFPEIILSFEKPPLLHKAEPYWESIPIDGVLGQYDSIYQRIIIYIVGIDCLLQRWNFDFTDLMCIVLLHEIAHWITHKLPHLSAQEWPLDDYLFTVSEVHEGLAQIIVYLYLQYKGISSLRRTFKRLTQLQPTAYNIYNKNLFGNLIKKNHVKIMNSLITLRNKRKSISSLNEWLSLI